MSHRFTTRLLVKVALTCALALMLNQVWAQDSKQETKPTPEAGQRAGDAQEAKPKAAITLHFTGLRAHKGILRVVLVDRLEAWMSKKIKPRDRRDIGLSDLDEKTFLAPFVVTFDNLEPGTYAISAYQDANGNNRLDTNFLGIPTERTGASNNPRPAMRAPRFSEAKFVLEAEEKKTIAITLR